MVYDAYISLQFVGGLILKGAVSGIFPEDDRLDYGWTNAKLAWLVRDPVQTIIIVVYWYFVIYLLLVINGINYSIILSRYYSTDESLL